MRDDRWRAFYAHPWAWNEIGFGGPAYPRGYARMGVGQSEAWEGAEALDLDPVPDVKRTGARVSARPLLKGSGRARGQRLGLPAPPAHRRGVPGPRPDAPLRATTTRSTC